MQDLPCAIMSKRVSSPHSLRRCILYPDIYDLNTEISPPLDSTLELKTKVRKDFTITEKAPIRAFSWLKVLTSTMLKRHNPW